MKSTPKMIVGVFFVFFSYGWTISPPRNKKILFIMCQQEKNTWTSDTEYGGDFAVAVIPPGGSYEWVWALFPVNNC